MVTNDECRGCGAAVPERSRFCPRCGRSVDAPLLDLERLDAPGIATSATGTRAPVQRAVAEQRGIGWSARTIAATAAVLAALVALVVIVSGGGGDGDGSPVDDAAPTTVPSTTERPRTTRPPRTTTIPPPPSAVVVDPGVMRPVVDSTGGGALSVYVAGGRDIGRVELATGRVTVAARVFAGSEPTSGLAVADGRLVIAREGQVYALAADLSGAPDAVRNVDGWSLQTYTQGRLLAIEYQDGVGQSAVARRVRIDGTVDATWLLPTNTWPVGFLGDRLVIQTGGRIYTIAPDGEVAPYATGDTIFADGRFVLWRECDDAMVCTLRVGDEGEPRRRVLQPDIDPYAGTLLLLAPDGRTAVVDGGLQPLRLVDLETGATVAELDLRTRPAWTPEGDWLITRADRDTLRAVSTRGLASIDFPLPPSDYGAQDLVLAVG